MPIVITTPKPPLNLFEVRRNPLTEAWLTVYEVPEYLVPATGPSPARTIDAAAIITGLIVCAGTATGVNLSLRVVNASEETFSLLTETFVPYGDFLAVPIDRQVLLSGELIQARLNATQTADAHFSFILNQREEFEVIT